MTTSTTPLCVDLDDTLLATDTLWESLYALLRQNPFWLFMLPIWLLRGRPWLKYQIVKRVTLDVTTLPYRPEVLEFLRQQYAQDRPIILATATHEKIALAVAQHLKIFTDVVASDNENNIKGRRKLAALEARYGVGGFDYMGDAGADIPIIQAARKGFLVAPSRALRQAFKQDEKVAIFPVAQSNWKVWLKLLRVHQWAKNVLIFIPLLLSDQIFNLTLIQNTLIAFFAFSLVASAGYVLNDLLDLNADRSHPTKCKRPFAAGLIPIQYGIPVFFSLVLLSAGMTILWLSSAFLGVLFIYFMMTLVYSFYLKRKPVVDVMVLAGLFTLRIIAGGVATTLGTSEWLLAFSVFIFTSLAFMKRYIELRQLADDKVVKNRNYAADDVEMIANLGATSGYLAVLVFSLYINSEEMLQAYQSPVFLWLICPALLYWISRTWLLAHRGRVADDPVLFAIKDGVSWVVVACIAVLVVLAKFQHF